MDNWFMVSLDKSVGENYMYKRLGGMENIIRVINCSNIGRRVLLKVQLQDPNKIGEYNEKLMVVDCLY